ncbi:hypothetical protein NHX12_022251 [Muraenolepis orangiensis]|uniref:DNA damage-inducible transcript 4 protein n=1 Tax=Muraenolepis orangiensis TaxID=630683 RepID=A0A9Q0ET67_9TELE|nr:hypothetical protein NHX12_022251 [Muraenolepis orangiensis]
MSFSSCSHSMDGSPPPSPMEDRVQRLSVGSLLQKLAQLKGTYRPTEEHRRGGHTGSVVDLSLSESSVSSDPLGETLCSDPLEETLSEEVVATIARSLSAASLGAAGRSSRLVPSDRLLRSIGRELVRLAAGEPCGLRGALIDLCVVDTGGRGDEDLGRTVDQIAVDPGLVPTFHVTLVLRTDTGAFWPRVQKLFFRTSRGPQSADARRPQTLRLSPGFRAIKRKLYCSGELVVEECC